MTSCRSASLSKGPPFAPTQAALPAPFFLPAAPWANGRPRPPPRRTCTAPARACAARACARGRHDSHRGKRAECAGARNHALRAQRRDGGPCCRRVEAAWAQLPQGSREIRALRSPRVGIGQPSSSPSSVGRAASGGGCCMSVELVLSATVWARAVGPLAGRAARLKSPGGERRKPADRKKMIDQQ